VSFGRYIFWLVVSILIAGFLAWAFVPTAVPVDVSKIEVGPMTVRVDGEGQTRVKDIYAISAPAAGRLLRIETEAGDKVIATKTRLAVIEPADPTILDSRSRAEAEATAHAAEDALALASAEEDRAQAELAFASSELVRAEKLSQNGTISRRALDVARLDVATKAAELKSAEATVQVRMHELALARARLLTPADSVGEAQCCVAITAPVDGQVLRILHESEGVVAAGEVLMEIGDPRHLEVVVDVLTRDAARIHEGALAVIENWGGDALNGTVRRIDPFGYTKVSVLGVEEQRVDVIIDFSDSDAIPKALGHGFRVEVGIQEWQGDGVLKAPMAALFRVDGGWAAFVLRTDETARLVPLTVGHLNGREAEVLSGLNAGDEVVLHPSERIKDGVSLARRKM
jgi:HlyD family secretion protein